MRYMPTATSIPCTLLMQSCCFSVCLFICTACVAAKLFKPGDYGLFVDSVYGRTWLTKTASPLSSTPASMDSSSASLCENLW